MYNAYGSNVFKKYQVNMGSPYQVRPRKASPVYKADMDVKETGIQKEAEAILENARLEAGKILQMANKEANEMLEAAQEKIAVHILEVEQKAKEDGYKKGEALARQHYQELLTEAEAMKKEAQKVLEETVSDMEEELVETVLQIGRKIIGMELSLNRDVILGLVRNALLGSSLCDEVIVHVSQDDYDYVEENKDRILPAGKNFKSITIIRDHSLQKGGCFIETGFGIVDSSIETQYAAVERALWEILGGGTVPEQDEE